MASRVSERNVDRLLDALRDARRDGSGVVLCHLDPEAIPRLMAWLARSASRAEWTQGDRARHLIRLSREEP